MSGKKENLITLTAVSYESLAMDTEIGFSPPGAGHSSDPDFDYHWRMIQYVFRLTDPAAIPPLGDQALKPDSQKAVRRFCDEADDLASSPFLAYPTAFNVLLSKGEESGSIEAPPGENERGFAVHLRQFYSAKERASFRRVADIAWVANERTGVGHAAARRDILVKWRKAEKKLRHRNVNVWVGLKLVREGKMAPVYPARTRLPWSS